MTRYRRVERHPWRERLCLLLNHGEYEERDDETKGALRVSTVVRRECALGHVWEAWERADAVSAPSVSWQTERS